MDFNLNEYRTIIKKLMTVENQVWGRYAISSELLKGKIDPASYSEIIDNAIACGESSANKIIATIGSSNYLEIAKFYNIDLKHENLQMGSKGIVFATFTTPNKIVIMQEPIAKATARLAKVKDIEIGSYETISSLLFFHELFHFIENKESKTIYTQKHEIVLWSILGFKYKSRLRVLSEIAAMAFAAKLCNIPYSPFMLDVVMLYPYDTKQALRLYNDIIELEINYHKEMGN